MKKEYYDIPNIMTASIENNPFKGTGASSANEKFIVWANGCGIGYPKNVQEGREKIHRYLVKELTTKIANLKEEIRYKESVLKTLGDDVFNLRAYMEDDE